MQTEPTYIVVLRIELERVNLYWMILAPHFLKCQYKAILLKITVCLIYEQNQFKVGFFSQT